MHNERPLIAAMAEQCKTSVCPPFDAQSDLPQPLHPRHLHWMCEQIAAHADAWPSTKLQRWIGFVQCGILANRILDFEGIKSMFDESKNRYGAAETDPDMVDHRDPANPFEFDIGGQG